MTKNQQHYGANFKLDEDALDRKLICLAVYLKQFAAAGGLDNLNEQQREIMSVVYGVIDTWLKQRENEEEAA